MTTTADTRFVKLSLYKATSSTFMFNEGVVSLPFDTFGAETYRIKESVLPVLDKLGSLELNGLNSNAVINGTRSKRTITPFREVSNLTPRAFNFGTDEIDDILVRSTSDDIAPSHFLGATLLANHSYYGYVAETPSAHGKVDSDIGSTYSYGGNTYVLISIIDATNLSLMDEVLGDNLLENVTLTHVSGGVSITDISITTHTYTQIYPCSSDYSLNIFVDGVNRTEVSGTFLYSDNVTFTETYNLISRDSLLTWYKTSYSSEINPIGDLLVFNNISYRFDVEGNCTMSGDYNFNEIISVQDIMALQAGSVAELDKYYIPKTIAFLYEGTSVNYSMIENSNTTSTTGTSSINFDSTKLDASTVPSDRWIQLGIGVGFAMGFLPVASAGVNRLNNTTSNVMQIRGATNKMYPRLLNKGTFNSAVGEAYSYVAYRNCFIPENGATANYAVRTPNEDYYFIDYHNTSGVYQFDMPFDFIGRTFEINESRNITCNSQVVANKLTVNVNCLSDYGYLVIKINK